MDFNTTIDIIIKDLKDAREIIDDLKNYPGVPQLQVELAKSKCKSAEEIIALLKTYKTEQEPKGLVKKEPEPLHPESLKDHIDNLIEIAEEEKSDVIGQQATEDLDNKIQGDLWPEKDLKQDEQLHHKKAESNIVADKFSHMSNIFNEQLGGTNNEDDVSAMLKAKPVENLSDAIGLNDKFLFIREIFGGNRTSYDEAITKLNKVENLPDAKAIIMSYTDEGDDNEVVKQLLDLVKRKLPSDG
jgi:hypothetical protein